MRRSADFGESSPHARYSCAETRTAHRTSACCSSRIKYALCPAHDGRDQHRFQIGSKRRRAEADQTTGWPAVLNLKMGDFGECGPQDLSGAVRRRVALTRLRWSANVAARRTVRRAARARRLCVADESTLMTVSAPWPPSWRRAVYLTASNSTSKRSGNGPSNLMAPSVPAARRKPGKRRIARTMMGSCRRLMYRPKH